MIDKILRVLLNDSPYFCSSMFRCQHNEGRTLVNAVDSKKRKHRQQNELESIISILLVSVIHPDKVLLMSNCTSANDLSKWLPTGNMKLEYIMCTKEGSSVISCHEMSIQFFNKHDLNLYMYLSVFFMLPSP